MLTIRNLQTIYFQELVIVELGQSIGNQLFDGHIADVPEELLDRIIVNIDTDFCDGAEYSRLIVDIAQKV